MHTVTTCLLLLVLTGAASLLARIVPLPLPFVQIGLGVAAALPPLRMQVVLEPDAFLLLFVPVLLFADGWRLPHRSLRALRWPVLGHAVGLVLLTVVAGGFGLRWLIPAMPLSVAFAVAAVVSPTDAVAVSSITEHMRVPSRMQHLLESEALLNDASGLVALRLAVAATLSGVFSLPRAGATFLVVALGGLAIGALLTLCYGVVLRRLLSRAEDGPVQTLLTGLLPFAAYALAEHLHVSGILAAVASGIAASRISLLEGAHFSSRLQTGLSWGVVTFCLNGTIFVLLGLQLPGIIGSGPSGIDLVNSGARLTILGQIAALTLMLIALRLLWVLTSALLGRLGRHPARQGWRVIVAASLAGVRGAVTLAGVLSLPLAAHGAPFPSRDLAITLATGVILLTMVVAALGLPLLLRGLPPEPDELLRERRIARIAGAEAAVRAIQAQAAPADPLAARLIAFLRERAAALHEAAADAQPDLPPDAGWRQLHRTALHAERDAMHTLRRQDRIDDTVFRQLLGELDMLEAALMQRPLPLGPISGGVSV